MNPPTVYARLHDGEAWEPIGILQPGALVTVLGPDDVWEAPPAAAVAHLHLLYGPRSVQHADVRRVQRRVARRRGKRVR